ncbi:MAG: HAD-IC family P-type ATPase, partial [Prevotella denticola]
RSPIAFVGDGINDAPVIKLADIGIAMGAVGSDAAIEAADIVLMNDNPMNIVEGMMIARKTLSIVKQNIVFAIGIKLLMLLLGALGVVNMWAAVFADVGVTILAILNALRSIRVSNVLKQ